jgi:hypothetical protein
VPEGGKPDMKTPNKDEMKEILIKNWMTHDAMWFYNCLQECGIEKTNKINRAAVRAMGMIEMKRIQKAAGIKKVETFEDFKSLSDTIWNIVKGDFMKFTYSYPAKNIMRADFQSCFAYDGIKQLGAIEQYQCGIFERIYAWFDAMDFKYSVSPKVEGCMMHSDGKCFREFTFTFTK